MDQEIMIGGKVFVACEKHTTDEYVVLYRKVPLEEEVAKRKKELEKGKLPVLLPKCPICALEMYEQCLDLKSMK
jgi:hypothetical protein